MHINTLTPDQTETIHQIATILVAAFAEHWPTAWPTIEDALKEVHESFEEGRISRVALSDEGEAVGWVGGIPEYDGLVWELHPLAVHPDHQHKGIGRALVADLEAEARKRGGITVQL